MAGSDRQGGGQAGITACGPWSPRGARQAEPSMVVKHNRSVAAWSRVPADNRFSASGSKLWLRYINEFTGGSVAAFDA